MLIEWVVVAGGLLGLLLVELVWYSWLRPCPLPEPLPRWALDHSLGNLLYILAYILSMLRLHFALVPYLLKLLIFCAARPLYRPYWSSYPFQAMRLIGDFVNWWVVSWLFVRLVPANPLVLTMVLHLVIMAEGIRLTAEKGQMLFSAGWQYLPHRRIARGLLRLEAPHWRRLFAAYCNYYALEDIDRLTYILDTLKSSARHHPELSARLEYVRAFRNVPQAHNLRNNIVRDVAYGAVFIHPRWTNDPWLLVGQALRRSPWLFDPRYVPRPFYYRSQSNRLATQFVLRHARWSLPYAWYQFGHEIKVARYDAFFRLIRRFGQDVEQYVQVDGTYPFDPLRRWLIGESLGNRPLWTDEEVVAEVMSSGKMPSAVEVAERYTYPLKYVDDVLLDKIYVALDQANAARIASAVTAGASQWG